MKKAGLVSIARMVSGSMFGDSDVFAHSAMIMMKDTGRDLSAISSEPSTLFVLNAFNCDAIKAHFPEIYEEMKEVGLQRFKILQLWIAHNLRRYISRAADGNN